MPRIDPEQLLKCLSVLLSPNGGIKSVEEVIRLVTLMLRFSKKLVSKCIYINILKCTETEILGSFMTAGGWSMTLTWLNEGIVAKNWPLVEEILKLLFLCPVDVERLKSNTFPRKVKALSKDASHTGVQYLATCLVDRWLKVVKGENVPPLSPSEIPVPPLNLNSDLLTDSLSALYNGDIEHDSVLGIKTECSDADVDDKSGVDLLKCSDKSVTSDNNNSTSGAVQDVTDAAICKDSSKGEDKQKAKEHKSSHSEKGHGDRKSQHKSSKSSRSSSSSSHKSKDRSKSDDKRESDSKERSKENDRAKDRSKDKHKSKHRSSEHKSSEERRRSSDEKHKSSSDRHKSSESKHKSSDGKSHSETSKSKDKSKLQTISINDLGKIPKKTPPSDESQTKKSKPSISIEVRKSTDTNRPKTVKMFNSKFRSHGLEEEAKPPLPRTQVKKPTPTTAPPVVAPVLPKRTSSSSLLDAPPEKKSRLSDVDKPGAIKLIPPKPKLYYPDEWKYTYLRSNLLSNSVTAFASLLD